jgi:hypothetical protein
MLGMTKLFRDDIGDEPPLSPPEPKIPVCPVCGAETWELVRDRWGATVGCLGCVDVVDTLEQTEHELGYYRNGGV